jgi:2-polyprenyl-6-hydroxyphenyl methylase/3-demethylubiquinone-9 3-methyltransferase
MRNLGKFDIAFSWGVLHHTGAMYDAIKLASQTTKPEGQFIFALYRKTSSCGFWTAEKKWYVGASPTAQKIATKLYIGLFRLAFLIRGRDFNEYVQNTHIHMRGMEFETAVQDWIGGYPYESISPDEVESFMSSLNFQRVRSVVAPKTLSLLGSGCDEFVYRPS